MTLRNKEKISAMLKGIETGDTDAVAVVNEAKYIQHNPQTHEGSDGLAVLFSRLSQTNPRVNTVRSFEDDEFVFAHMEYDFSRRNVGFEVFRFEDGHAVEHWDNIQKRLGPNQSGRSMVDGPAEASDHDRTEENRTLVRTFAEAVLIGKNLDRIVEFVALDYAEHNPDMTDGIGSLQAVLDVRTSGDRMVDYQRLHRVLAEGNFVLAVCEGTRSGAHTAFYDLFRVADGKIVEHWDTVETIAPRSEWKNDNGKF